MLPTLLILLWIFAFLSALGCDSLRDFSYSRLETLCRERGVPDRFGQILKSQGSALLALEFSLTSVTLILAAVLCVWIGWPMVADGEMTHRIAWQFVFQYAGYAVLTFLAADVLPWTIARVDAESFLCRWWPAIEFLQVVLRPVLWIADQLDRYAHRLVGRAEPQSDNASLLEEDIRSVVGEGEREGVLQSGSTAMISRVMQVQDEDVGAIMTPRTEMDCVPADCTLEEARLSLIESGHSRMPVIGDSTDDVLGILYAKDLLKALEPHRTGEPFAVVRDIIREPVYIPITTRIPALLELMKRQKVHIAMVSDEYGGVAGLVTMEDILEEIVGEIDDEYDDESTPHEDIKEVSPTVVEADGRVRLDELNRQFDYGIPNSDGFDTIGGFTFSQMGRMPKQGECLEWERLRISVLEADLRRVLRVRIELLGDIAEKSPNGEGRNT
ncbi:MAG: HlyC/CorC family transporter [Planctomycetes bacterium]|nr:HlyC/CorC family transporter [Planctomycetota bacterium]